MTIKGKRFLLAAGVLGSILAGAGPALAQNHGGGFSWFLPVLPLAYATYWWGGLPYYYANDVYYTWSPDYSGYVATDPPPLNDSSAPGSATSSDAPPPEASSQPLSGAPAQIFMYPKNGQSTEQQTQDRTECQQW